MFQQGLNRSRNADMIKVPHGRYALTEIKTGMNKIPAAEKGVYVIPAGCLRDSKTGNDRERVKTNNECS